MNASKSAPLPASNRDSTSDVQIIGSRHGQPAGLLGRAHAVAQASGRRRTRRAAAARPAGPPRSPTAGVVEDHQIDVAE